MSSRVHRSFVSGAAVLALTVVAHGDVLYVDAGATGSNTGTSWADAYASLQPALAAAAVGDEIWVAAGVYVPGSPGQTSESFRLKTGVMLLGGFAGGETSRTQRDWSFHPTVLSGDLGQDDTFGGGAWYQGWNIHTPNSAHVVIADGVDATAVIDGFTVRAGYAASTSEPGGGGMYINAASPTVRNCTFYRNLAGFNYGGGVFAYNSSPTFAGCTFYQNWVHLGQGGGAAVYGPGVGSFVDCVFTENYCNSGSGGAEGQGGGLSVWSATSASVTRCTFQYNQASQFNGAGGYELARGGGVSCFLTPITIRDCVFSHNSAPAGAGLSLWNAATLINCTFWDNLVYETVLSGGWSDGGYAGGVLVNSFQPVDCTMINCVLARNRGFESAGFEAFNSARSVLRNCVVWGNIATNPEVGPRGRQFQGSHSIRYSCVQDLLTPDPGEDPPDAANYPGCIVVDPLLVNAATGDFQLRAGSPCIDAGDNTQVPSGIATDLAGLNRFFDDPGTANTGNGMPPLVDMGAFEFGAGPCTAVIEIQPTDQIACPGDSVTFTILASEASGFQWRFESLPIPGADQVSYSIAAVGAADVGLYDCVVTNACGSVVSTAAILSIGGCCPADFDGDGFVTGIDFDLYVQAFEGGNGSADFDGDGFITGIDFDLYVAAYESGC